jgi:hypothetical protein
MGDPERKLFGLQFHPEVVHTTQGDDILRRFLFDACGCAGDSSSAGVQADNTKAVIINTHRKTLRNARFEIIPNIIPASYPLETKTKVVILLSGIVKYTWFFKINLALMPLHTSNMCARIKLSTADIRVSPNHTPIYGGACFITKMTPIYAYREKQSALSILPTHPIEGTGYHP